MYVDRSYVNGLSHKYYRYGRYNGITNITLWTTEGYRKKTSFISSLILPQQ